MKTTVKIMLTAVLLAVFYAYLNPGKNESIAWTTRIEHYVKHTVQTGDTLEKLAKIYGTTVIRIVSSNKISGDKVLSEGQQLVIPVNGYREKLII